MPRIHVSSFRKNPTVVSWPIADLNALNRINKRRIRPITKTRPKTDAFIQDYCHRFDDVVSQRAHTHFFRSKLTNYRCHGDVDEIGSTAHSHSLLAGRTARARTHTHSGFNGECDEWIEWGGKTAIVKNRNSIRKTLNPSAVIICTRKVNILHIQSTYAEASGRERERKGEVLK